MEGTDTPFTSCLEQWGKAAGEAVQTTGSQGAPEWESSGDP